jgi:hypothetical protein
MIRESADRSSNRSCGQWLNFSHYQVARRGKKKRSFQFSSSSTFYQSGDTDQNHRADKRHNNGANHSAAWPDSQDPEDPATQKAAQDAKDDVHEYAEATALHDYSREPTRDQSNHDPRNEPHGHPPEVILDSLVQNVRLLVRDCHPNFVRKLGGDSPGGDQLLDLPSLVAMRLSRECFKSRFVSGRGFSPAAGSCTTMRALAPVA